MSYLVMRDINYDLLARLATRAHPLLHIADDFEAQLPGIPPAWVGEVFQQARSAHHLLDLAGVPRQASGHYSSDLDARTWLMMMELLEARERLARIAGWHCREVGPAGMVGDFCMECGLRWPCETRRMADGDEDVFQ